MNVQAATGGNEGQPKQGSHAEQIAKLGGEGGMDRVRFGPGTGFYSRDDAPSRAWLRALLEDLEGKGPMRSQVGFLIVDAHGTLTEDFEGFKVLKVQL